MVGGGIIYDDILIEGCNDNLEPDGFTASDDGGGIVTFATEDGLAPGEEVVLGLIADVTSDLGECVSNRACVEQGFLFDGAGFTVDQLDGRTCDDRDHLRAAQTPTRPTPTVTATATPKPTSTPFVPPPPTATAKPLGTIAAPPTGSGTDGGSSRWLALGLGLGGMCLLVVSGTALAKKRIR